MALTPFSFSNPWAAPQGGFGDQLVTQLQAPYGRAVTNNVVFGATRAAATIPVNATTLVSVFFIYNPVGSGVNLVLLDCVLTNVLATTVVNAYGLYTGTAAEIAAGTFTTPGTVFSQRINGAIGAGAYYSAYTHSGTPTLRAIVAGHGATTASTHLRRTFEGGVVIPAGGGVSLAASTAASTTSGMTVGMTWMEVPGT